MSVSSSSSTAVATSSSSTSSASPSPLTTTTAGSIPSLNDIDSFITSKQYDVILCATQRRELEDGGNITKDTEVWYGVGLIASALVKENLTSKFIWNRIPKDIKKKSKDLLILWKLLTSLQRNDYATFFHESIIAQTNLSIPLLQRLNTSLRDEIHSMNMSNIRRAYTTISLDQASNLLGTKKETTAAYLTSLGWTIDTSLSSSSSPSSSQYFNPTPLSLPKAREISVRQIEELTQYITHLEEE